jgi:anthranilate phosphoribosyltransferase
LAISLAVARKNEMLDALINECNSGKLRIYADATPPATADTALGDAVQLAELTLNATSFPSASGGTLTANAITGDSSADATGTAAFFRIYQSDGSTVVWQGSVTATGGGGDLQLATVSIVAAAVINVTSLTLSI